MSLSLFLTVFFCTFLFVRSPLLAKPRGWDLPGSKETPAGKTNGVPSYPFFCRGVAPYFSLFAYHSETSLSYCTALTEYAAYAYAVCVLFCCP